MVAARSAIRGCLVVGRLAELPCALGELVVEVVAAAQRGLGDVAVDVRAREVLEDPTPRVLKLLKRDGVGGLFAHVLEEVGVLVRDRRQAVVGAFDGAHAAVVAVTLRVRLGVVAGGRHGRF